MSNTTQKATAGYYLVTLRPSNQGALLASNNERAFVVSCLQDSLTSRYFPETQPMQLALPSHIDLLAFSIQKEAIQLILFAISYSSAQTLAHSLIKQINYYHDNWDFSYPASKRRIEINAIVRTLLGPHDALRLTTQLHASHTDWEYDRYSSIGFYLHDRRGDWMRIWRLSHLYDSNEEHYRNLMRFALNGFRFEELDARYRFNKEV